MATRKKPATAKKVEKLVPLMETLRSEHRHLSTVVELFKEQLEAIELGQMVDTHVVYEVMDYIVRWPDRFHHPREDLIYGRVAEIDAQAADNVDSLQREHDVMAKQSRGVLRDIENWREGGTDGAAVVKSGRAYVERLYAHMNSEEKLVFPQIEAVLSAADWRELEADDRLQPLADPLFGGRVDREFRNLARRLRRKLRVGVERGVMLEWVGIEALMESLEVISMAYDTGRAATGDHLRTTVEDNLDIMRESPLLWPWRCALNNGKTMLTLLGDISDIGKDVYQDLSQVNQSRKDRARLLGAN
jgi:hemerythrin-like domain-containing protein